MNDAAPPEGKLGRITVEALHAIVLAAARRAGFAEDDAGTVATVIADADLHGSHSHGARLFATHLPQLRSGAIRVDARPAMLRDGGATMVIDGDDGYGPVVCSFAVDRVLRCAAEAGMAAVAVRRSSHWGCPSVYARRGAAQGLLLVGASNTSAAMPLWGAGRRSVGNNPVIFGVPGSGGDDWILDFSMQQAAWGKLAVYRDSGSRLPAAWGYDAERRPTDDPAAIIESGLIRPMGDHKGSGLAVIVEALTGGLAGDLHSGEIRSRLDAGETQHKSQFFLAIDPDAFGGRPAFARLVASFAAMAAGLEPADGFDRVRLPGEGSAERARENRRNGIAITPTLRKAIDALEEFVGTVVDR